MPEKKQLFSTRNWMADVKLKRGSNTLQTYSQIGFSEYVTSNVQDTGQFSK
jgi:hypothetical protein